MREFRDTQGRLWAIEIDLDTLTRLEESGPRINLLEILDGDTDTGKTFAKSAAAAGAVLWAVVEPDAIARKVEKADLFRSLKGDSFRLAAEAVVDAVVDFFGSQEAEAHRKLIALNRQMGMLMRQRAIDGLSQSDPETITAALAELTEQYGMGESLTPQEKAELFREALQRRQSEKAGKSSDTSELTTAPAA